MITRDFFIGSAFVVTILHYCDIKKRWLEKLMRARLKVIKRESENEIYRGSERERESPRWLTQVRKKEQCMMKSSTASGFDIILWVLLIAFWSHCMQCVCTVIYKKKHENMCVNIVQKGSRTLEKLDFQFSSLLPLPLLMPLFLLLLLAAVASSFPH